jgi:putative colanic acid biosysnthesis UDP-glucose lipid carrier transferase
MPDTTLSLSTTGVSPRRTSGSLGKNKLLPAIEAILDPMALAFSVWMISIVYEGGLLSDYLILSALVFAITFPGTSHLQSSIGRMMSGVFISWILIASTLLLLGFVSKDLDEFSKPALITLLWAAPLCQIGARLALRAVAPYLVRLQGAPQRAIIVGMNEQGMALASRIDTTEYSGIELSGFFDDRDRERLDNTEDLSAIGNLKDLPTFVKENNIQLIYLSLPMTSQPRILEVLDELKDTTASIYFVPDMFVTNLIQGHSGAVCGMPVISVCETPFTGTSGTVKWISDMILSVLILILISPILLIIAAAVKFGSPGPIIFKQRRYGLDGEEILVYKFRSMTVCEDGGSIQQAQKDDSRLTRLGAFLRKTSLDELPQFVNVLQGRMSIVGPRPHAVAHNELYRSLIKGYMIRHKVKPGITGWAQVNGFRGETDTLDKMQSRIDFDLDYLRHWTLKLDLQIILKTLLVVFKREAAY